MNRSQYTESFGRQAARLLGLYAAYRRSHARLAQYKGADDVPTAARRRWSDDQIAYDRACTEFFSRLIDEAPDKEHIGRRLSAEVVSGYTFLVYHGELESVAFRTDNSTNYPPVPEPHRAGLAEDFELVLAELNEIYDLDD